MIEITLKVTTVQLMAIAKILQDEQPPIAPLVPIGPSIESVLAKISTSSTRKKGGKQGPKMASFGRTQEQVDAYVEAEANRTEELDEEAELKRQRAEERAAKKEEKDLEEVKEIAEVDAIKAKVSAIPETTALAFKPWTV